MKKSNIHTNGGFKIPKGYFENFEDNLLESLPSNEEHSGILSNQIDTGLKTPDGYFDSLEDRLLITIKEQQNSPKVISLFTKRNIISLVSIAAMIVIIISIVIPKRDNKLTFDSIEIAEIQEYLDEENIELSETDIAVLLEDENNLTNTFSINTDHISDEILLDYLSDTELEDEMIHFE